VGRSARIGDEKLYILLGEVETERSGTGGVSWVLFRLEAMGELGGDASGGADGRVDV
jgi:hypothetical protein